jgi:hypothetical protein
MASGLRTTERNRYLTATFKTQTVYGACCTADPGDATAMSGVEVADLYDYARTAITFGDDADAGSISNTGALTFPAANGGSHGLITHLAICTTNVQGAATAIANGLMTASKQIDDHDQLVFATANITVSIAPQA